MTNISELGQTVEPIKDVSLEQYRIIAKGLLYPQDIGANYADSPAMAEIGVQVGEYIRQAKPAHENSRVK